MFQEEQIDQYISVRDQVAKMLRRMITTGKLVPGEKLNERVISEQLNISTTPVKEALRILESEGLIHTVARKGSYVSDFSSTHVRQVIYARAALEGTAAYFSTESMTEEGIAQLARILEESEHCKTARDSTGFSACNTRFHQFLRQNCHNEYINRMIEILRAMDRTCLDMTLRKSEDEFELSYLEHAEILDAIRRGECETVERRVVQHIRRTANRALENEE